MKGFYIKQSDRVNKDSGYKCFDIYDENKNLIQKTEYDVIDISIESIRLGRIMFEIVDDMIHIWTTSNNFEVNDLLVNTFYVRYKSK